MAASLGWMAASLGSARRAGVGAVRRVGTASRQRRRHEKTYAITGRGEGCAATVTARGHTLVTDVPRAGGGADAAPQPVETLLAALIGCETATAHFVARQLGVRVGSIDFEIRASRDVRGSAHVPVGEAAPAPSRLQRIEGVATVATDDPALDAATLAELGRVVHERCPVANMVAASGCDLAVAWRLAT